MFEDTFKRYGIREAEAANRRKTEMLAMRKLLQSKDGSDEASLISQLRKQLMQSLDRNKKLVMEVRTEKPRRRLVASVSDITNTPQVGDLHEQNTKLSTTIMKVRRGEERKSRGGRECP